MRLALKSVGLLAVTLLSLPDSNLRSVAQTTPDRIVDRSIKTKEQSDQRTELYKTILARPSDRIEVLSQLKEGDRKAEKQSPSLNTEAEAKRLLKVSTDQIKAGEAIQALESAARAANIADELKNSDLSGQTFVIAARACSQLGLDPQAIALAQKAIVLAQNTKNLKLEGTALVWQAISTSSLQKGQAIRLAQQALTIAQKTKDRELEAWAYFSLANTLGQKEGTEAAEKSLQIARELQNPELQGWATLGVVTSNIETENYQKASDAVQQVLKLSQTIKNRTLEGYAIAFDGVIAVVNGNNGKIVQSVKSAISLSEELKNPQIRLIASLSALTAFVKEGSYQQAIDTSKSVLERTRELKKLEYELVVLKLQIASYVKLEDYQSAVEPAQRIVTVGQEQKNSSVEIEGLLALGQAQVELKDYQNTIKSAQRVVVIAQEQKDLSTEISGLSLLTRAYVGSKQVELAAKASQRVNTIAQMLPNPRAKVTALLQVRSTYESIGDTQRVTELEEQVLSLVRQQNDAGLAWDVAGNLAASRLSKTGDFREVARTFDEYLKISQQRNEVDSTKLLTIGAVYFLTEDYKKIDEMTSHALNQAKKTNNRDQEIGALLGSALAYSLTQNNAKLQEILISDLPKFQKSQNLLERANAFLISYLIYNSAQDHQKAIESIEAYQKLIPKVDTSNSKELQPIVVDVLRIFAASNYAKINRNKEAIAALQNGLAKLDQYFLALSPIAKTSGIDVSESGKTALLNPIKGILLTQIAEIYRHSGDKSNAIAYYRKALSVPVVSSDQTIARPKSADERTLMYAIAAKIDQLLNFSLFSYYRNVVYTGLGRTYQQLNLPSTATTYYKQAINQLEQKRKDLSARFPKSNPTQSPNLASSNLQTFSQNLFLKGSLGDFEGSRNSDIYRELANLLITQGRLGEAQQVLELLKVQELNEFAKGTRSETLGSQVGFNETEKQLVKDYGSVIAFGNQLEDCKSANCSQLTTLQSKYDSLFDAFTQLTAAIEKRAQEAQERGVAVRTDDFNQSASKIANQPNTVLIYPLVLPDKVYLLWMARGKVRGSQVCPMGQTKLWTTVKDFHDLLRNPNSNVTQVKATGKILYDCLIKPLEPELAKNNIQTLVFVPDRAINYVPIGALYDGQKYLAERYTTSTVLNAQLTDMSDRLPINTQNTPVLALGMSEEKPGFPALLNVPTELSAIVKQTPADPKGIYPGLELLNQAFTLNSLRGNLRDRRILHIATHGAFIPEDPKASFLLLGDGKKYPIYQVQDLDELRNIHLVVLSACETALGGADQNGNEIAGISSYFLKDRAKAVIASLWSVNDASTSLLMQQFYRNLATGKMTKSEALRQAQLSLLEGKVTANAAPSRATIVPKLSLESQTNNSAAGFSHPYYWAPFILIGNGL